MTKDKKQLIKEALDSFKIIHDCLLSYQQGKEYMFKPIAGQLRILYCDSNDKRKIENSLLHHIYPELKLIALQKHSFTKELEIDGLKLTNNCNDLVSRRQPYEITEFENGIKIADLDFSNPPTYLSLCDWRNQIVDSSLNLTIEKIIRSVADKDGGAHVDLTNNQELSIMKQSSPIDAGLHILFIIALARFTIRFAQQYANEWAEIYPDIFK